MNGPAPFEIETAMKISVQKLPDKKLKVTVETSSAKKPLVFEMTEGQVESALKVLAMASKSDTFSLSYEV